MTVALLGWAANVFVVLGLWAFGYKQRRAFLLSLTGAALWATKAGLLGAWDLMTTNVVILAMNGWGYWKWGVKPSVPEPCGETAVVFGDTYTCQLRKGHLDSLHCGEHGICWLRDGNGLCHLP